MQSPQDHIIPEDLFLKIAAGDEAAFTQAFYFYNKRIYPYLLRKLRSKELAREIVQDVFLKLWLIRDKLPEISHHEPYLFRMVANQLLDYFRKEGYENRMKTEVISREGLQIIEPVTYRSETRQMLDDAVEQLPPERKRVYQMRMEGFSYEEIASYLDVSVHTVRNQIASATKAIKEHLRDQGLAALIAIILWKGL